MKIVLGVALLLMNCGLATGQNYKVLYNFGTNGTTDGQNGIGSLISDNDGNLYGTTMYGGAYQGGTVFELSPNSDGSWSETVLYSFCYYNNFCPYGTGAGDLIIDKAGNLYGIAHLGGLECANTTLGCGLAFELSPPVIPGGAWTYNIIHEFCSVGGDLCLDGAGPEGRLTFDKSGNLYGAAGGGLYSGGIVYELSPGSNGWTESVLYNFCSNLQGGICLDGNGPAGVTFDSLGNLYGTTGQGGQLGEISAGALYKLANGSGSWTETVLATFTGKLTEYGRDVWPGPVTIDPRGNLYTTQGEGGIYEKGNVNISYGAVDELNIEGIKSQFLFNGTNGDGPYNGVLADLKRHALLGTTGIDNHIASEYNGNIFQIDESGKETVLYRFCLQSGCADGAYPGGLLEDSPGNLYGVTFSGGAYNEGTAFEFTP